MVNLALTRSIGLMMAGLAVVLLVVLGVGVRAADPVALPVASGLVTADPPPVPPGWHRATSGRGTVSLGLPADFGVIVDADSLVANPPPKGAPAWITVLAGMPDPTGPGPDEPLTDWLLAAWSSGGTGWSAPITREVLLPAGRATQVTRQKTFAGTPWTSVLFGVRTTAGVGILVIEGPTDQMVDRSAELEAITYLLWYPPTLSHPVASGPPLATPVIDPL